MPNLQNLNSREASNLQTEPKEVCEFLRLALNMKSIFKWNRNHPDPLGTRLMEWFDYRVETRVIDSTVRIEDVFNKKIMLKNKVNQYRNDWKRV